MPRRARPHGIDVALALGALLALTGCEEVAVNVVDAASVEISPENVTVYEGGEQEVAAIPRSAAGEVLTGRSVAWSTDDPEVAVVSEGGVVRGEARGTTTIRVRTEGVEGSAPVTVVPRPRIALSRSEVEFRGILGAGDLLHQEVEVVNEGGGTLTGLSIAVETENDDADWLTASLGNATAPTVLIISAAVGSLETGEYEGTVRVSAPEAGNSPQEVQVTLRVEEPAPVIHVDPTSVTFSSVSGSFQTAKQDVEVTNVGGKTLSGLSATIEFLSGRPNWLSADLDSTTAPTVLELAASAWRLSSGTYHARVEVSSDLIPGGSRIIEVEFVVGPR